MGINQELHTDMTQSHSEGELVTVTPRTQLSFHELQDIYSTLTGKSEKISSQFTKPYQIKFSDFENLDARIRQCCDSYGARIKNGSVTVYHISGQSEQFSSFDRFRLYNQSNTSPVENINIEYNFIIIPAGSTEPKQYKIRIGLTSRVGIFEKSPDMSVGPLSIISMLGRVTGGFHIDFSDYAVARHYQTQIEEWYEALEFGPERRWLTSIQMFSHWFRQALPLLAMMIVAYAFYIAPNNARTTSGMEPDLYASMILFGAAMTLAFYTGSFAGRLIEWGVDRIQSLSFVHLNKGDEKLIAKWSSRNLKSVAALALGVLAAIFQNIAAVKIIESWL